MIDSELLEPLITILTGAIDKRLSFTEDKQYGKLLKKLKIDKKQFIIGLLMDESGEFLVDEETMTTHPQQASTVRLLEKVLGVKQRGKGEFDDLISKIVKIYALEMVSLLKKINIPLEGYKLIVERNYRRMELEEGHNKVKIQILKKKRKEYIDDIFDYVNGIDKRLIKKSKKKAKRKKKA